MLPDTRPYADVPGFIYGCTREIWEDRGVGEKLERYYAPGCLVRSPAGMTTTMANVTRDTLATIHQFPDRQLVGEDVIWTDCGDGTFLSSHRLLSVMRHEGDGSYGPATGRLVKARVIADCWVKDSVVTEEWLVRDQGAIARCLGIEPRALAATQLAADVAAGNQPFFTPEQDRPSRYTPRLSDDPAALLHRRALERLWGAKTPGAIRELYHAGAAVYLPGGDWANGHDDLDRALVGWLASFPDAVLTVDDLSCNRDPDRPPRTTARFSLRATHSGWGRFGQPTGAPVYLMGIAHAHVEAGRIAAEWLLFDEVPIWKQILSAAA